MDIHIKPNWNKPFMSESPDQPNSKPEKTWLSSLMLVLGVLSVFAAFVAFFESSFLAGLFGLTAAAIFLALGRALDYLQEILLRLERLESKEVKR